MTIRAVDIYGRDALTRKEKEAVKAANMTAASIFKRRHEHPYNQELTTKSFSEVEAVVIEAIQKGRQNALANRNRQRSEHAKAQQWN